MRYTVFSPLLIHFAVSNGALENVLIFSAELVRGVGFLAHDGG